MLAVHALWKREIIRFYRQRDRVVGAFATPFLFWIVIGSGFGSSFRFASSYLDYLFPGIIILSLLFTAIFATISIIEDRKEGFLQSVLVAPVSRAGMVLGKILGASSIAVLQAILFLLLAPFIGIQIDAMSLLLSTTILFLIAFAFSNLGFFIAWRSTSTQGFHAVMNLFLMPMWLLSGAFFPVDGSPFWIEWIMLINPLTYGLDALRSTLYPDSPGVSILSLTVTAFFALFTFVLVVLTVTRRQSEDIA